MGMSLQKKLSLINGLSSDSINEKTILETMQKTQYSENEIFKMLKRFMKFNPDTSKNWLISINDILSMEEFANNPYTPLFFNAIDIYKIIYDYLKKINFAYVLDNEEFIHSIENTTGKIERVYEIRGEKYSIENEIHQKKQEEDDSSERVESEENYQLEDFLFELNYKDDIKNCTNCINFELFCIILNNFNVKKSLDFKFRVCFNIFDIDKNGVIDFKDLKNYFFVLFLDSGCSEEFKNITQLQIEDYVKKVLEEFAIFNQQNEEEIKINLNNFQQILWTSNFISNFDFEP